MAPGRRKPSRYAENGPQAHLPPRSALPCQPPARCKLSPTASHSPHESANHPSPSTMARHRGVPLLRRRESLPDPRGRVPRGVRAGPPEAGISEAGSLRRVAHHADFPPSLPRPFFHQRDAGRSRREQRLRRNSEFHQYLAQESQSGRTDLSHCHWHLGVPSQSRGDAARGPRGTSEAARRR